MNNSSKELRRLRKAAGLSAATVAKKLGISRALLCDIEHGRRALTPQRVVQVRELFGWDLQDLAASERQTFHIEAGDLPALCTVLLERIQAGEKFAHGFWNKVSELMHDYSLIGVRPPFPRRVQLRTGVKL